MRRYLPWAFLLFANCTHAHDLYLVKDGDRICARIGEHFPESMNAIPVDRLENLTFNGKPLQPTIDEAHQQTCAPLPSSAVGVVQAVVPPRFIRLPAKDFTDYITAEGLKSVVAARQSNPTGDGRELYSRYSKALLGAAQDATRRLGHVLEIVPENDPATLKAGEPLTVRVFFRGEPLRHVKIAAMYAGAKTIGHEYPVSTVTDEQGRATLKLDRAGLWYARLIHMLPSHDDPDYDWRSFFATLTFVVPNS